MAHTSLDRVLLHVRNLAVGQGGKNWTDGELLRAFSSCNDQEAFAVLTRRHGPLVLAVCRRVLGQLQDAEDVFQATFILLARYAAALMRKDSLSGWLHGVAYRMALNARRAAARRRKHERQVQAMKSTTPAWQAAWREVQVLLDDEVQRLPEKYREPFILCCLGGQSCSAAARQLGVKQGTIWSRLAEARKRLQGRLSRRGVALTAVLGTAALAPNGASATVPAALVGRTVELSMSAAASKGLSAGVISHGVAILVKGMTRNMLLKKAKLGAMLFLAVSTFVGLTAMHANQVTPSERTPSRKDFGESPALKRQADSLVMKDLPLAMDRYGDPLPDGAATRLGTLRFRHEGNAVALAFTPDGKTLVGYTNSGIIIWDAANGKQRHRLHVHEPMQNHGMDVSPDGTMLAVSEKRLSLWDLQSGKRTRVLTSGKIDGEVPYFGRICFSPDGKSLAVSSAFQNDSKIFVFDPASGQVRAALGDEDSQVFYHFAISPDSKTLAAAVRPNYDTVPSNSTVQLWDLVKGKLIRTLHKLPEGIYVTALAFSRNGNMLAFGTSQGVFLFNLATGKESGRLEAKKMGKIVGLGFTPDGARLVAASDFEPRIRVWEISTGKVLQVLDGGRMAARSMALARDGKTVALGSVGHAVRLWDVATGKELFTEYQGHDAYIISLAFSPNGKTLASATRNYGKILNAGQVFLWDRASGLRTGILPGVAHMLSFSADGEQLATAISYSAKVPIWNMASGMKTSEVTIPDAEDVVSALFSGDGRKLFTLDWKKTGTDIGTGNVRHWDLASGKQDQAWTIPEQKSLMGCLAPDGKTVFLVPRQDVITIYDAERRRQRLLRARASDDVASLVPSPDARMLAVGMEGPNAAVRMWELVTGKELFTLSGHEGSVYAIAWSADGRLLATGNQRHFPNSWLVDKDVRQTVRLWDTATGKELAQFTRFNVDVMALTFSLDSKSLVAGLRDSTILIWDIRKTHPALAPAPKFGADELEFHWRDLAGDNAAKAHQAIGTLAAAPKQSVPFLQGRLKPIATVDPVKIQQWIADLADDKFPVRQSAAKELTKAGSQARQPLQKALEGNTTLEGRRRLEQILNLFEVPDPPTLRTIRAIMALERIGSPEAQGALEILAHGAPGARETEEAKASLQRLAQRP